jgi:signal transduction histidine kinase
MAWATVLNRNSNSKFQSLRWQLLLSYLLVMTTILGLFALGGYVFFTRSLYKQLDNELQTLAEAAAPSLMAVKKEGAYHLSQVDESPWHDLFRRDQQSLEWLSADWKSLARKGELSLTLPPEQGLQTSQNGKIRTFTIPIYTYNPIEKRRYLEGYIRASQSTESVRRLQSQLHWGLGLGGMITLILSSLGGMWLTCKALEPIQKSFQQLKHFTADASHELRSPLTAIKTSIGIMLNHPERTHPLDAKKIAAIASATNQMIRLVEDLLFLARTDATEVVSYHEWVPVLLDKVLLDLVELLEPQAQAKGIALKLQLKTGILVVGNASLLPRLFSNLLDNALQYTPAGGTIILCMTQLNQFVIIKVKDNGIGIAPERLQYIFQRFWRADKARSHRAGGLGLGLAIAQAIAEHHGGKITVTSQVEAGSCFQVRLPIIG